MKCWCVELPGTCYHTGKLFVAENVSKNPVADPALFVCLCRQVLASAQDPKAAVQTSSAREQARKCCQHWTKFMATAIRESA